MRIARLLSVVLAVLAVGLLWRRPRKPNRRSGCQTTSPTTRACCPPGPATCRRGRRQAVQRPADPLWVVYVDSFSGQGAVGWARSTMRAQRFRRPGCAAGDRHRGTRSTLSTCRPVTVRHVDDCRRHPQRNEIEPALRQGDWAGAAVAAANGLNTSDDDHAGSGFTWFGLLVVLAIIVARGLAAVAVDAAPPAQAAGSRVRGREASGPE